MSDIELFNYEGQRQLRTLRDDDGEPLFVSVDALALLDLRRSSIALLDDDEKGVRILDTPGGLQELSVLTESGLYSLILRSRKPEAKAIKRWILHEVLPSIRKTGSYGVSAPPSYPEALRGWAAEHELREAAELRVAELEPPAEKWGNFLSAEGTWDVNETAKALASKGAQTGEKRLFQQMADEPFGWLYWENGVWRVRQRVVERGYLAEKPGGKWKHPKTGKVQLGRPQVRVTPLGFEKLAEALVPTTGQLELL